MQKVGIDNPSRTWTGKWIWPKNIDESPVNTHVLFRKELQISPQAGSLTLHVSADTRYRLFINGVRIGQGPPMSQPYNMYFDTYEYTIEGDESRLCIGAEVYHLGTVPDTRGGFLLDAIDGSGTAVASTDGSWRVMKAHAWASETHKFEMNIACPFQEFYDARLEEEGWKEPGFNDSGWDQGETIGGRISDRVPMAGPWTRVQARDIPFMKEEPKYPEEITTIEECIYLESRKRPGDRSILLSAVGNEVEHTAVHDPENLLTEVGVTIIQGSQGHKDGTLDGIYDPCILLDFGRVIDAFVEIELEGPSGGFVDIGYAERLVDGKFNNAIEGSFATHYCLRDGPQSFRTFDWLGFRYLKLRFSYCEHPVKIKRICAITTSYPFDNTGSFQSSDDILNKVFEICRYTVRLCSNEYLTDTPWREQGQWLGDVSAVTLGAIYSCFGNVKLPEKYLRQTGECQYPTGLISNMTNSLSHKWNQVLPDYSLWWVIALQNHYEFTGDDQWIHQFYPHAVRLLYTYLRYVDDDGMLANFPYWVFIDWAATDRRGQCASHTAIFHLALRTWRTMARLKGDRHVAELCENTSAAIERSFHDIFYDTTTGCYVDAVIDGEQSSIISEHTNALAIYSGLAKTEHIPGIVDALFRNKTIQAVEAQPFFTTFILRGLDKIGEHDLAVQIIKTRWGKRMIDRGATSTHEEWGTNGSWRSGKFTGFMRTVSHAWSGFPAEYLIRNVSGFEIIEPGCSRIRLSPRDLGIDYSITIPVPQGAVQVENTNGAISISVPHGVEVVR